MPRRSPARCALVAAQAQFAAATDQQFVIAGAVVVALRRVGTHLHDALVGIDLDRADRLQQIRQPLGQRVGHLLQLLDGRIGQRTAGERDVLEGQRQGIQARQLGGQFLAAVRDGESVALPG